MAFTATARIPCRPLSTENQDLAEPKELLVDYNTGVVRICKADGTFVDMGDSIKTVIMEQIKSDPNITKNIIIQIDGKDYALETVVLKNRDDIAKLKNALGYTETDGDISFEILKNIQNSITNINNTIVQGNVSPSADNIKDTENKVMMTKDERNKLSELSKPQTVQVTVGTSWSGSSAPFSQTISCTGVTSNDVPVVDIVLSSTYSTAMTQLDNYAYLYRITTGTNQIVVYATQKTTTALTLQLKFDRTIR